MKNLITIKNILATAVLGTILSGCTIEPIREDNRVVIRDAPEWVNNGSMISGGKEGRQFIGVSSVTLQGDLALQKSIAEDRSKAEVARIFLSYIDEISNEYLNNSNRYGRHRIHEESVLRKIDESALRQINESVASQIDDAITRKFKEGLSQQSKNEVSRLIKEAATRKIREAVANQVDFLLKIEEDVSAQLNLAAAYPMKRIITVNLAGTRVIANWRDPTTNMMWTLTELDMVHVKNTIAGISDMNVDLKSYLEANAESVFDRIVRDRDNQNSFSRR